MEPFTVSHRRSILFLTSLLGFLPAILYLWLVSEKGALVPLDIWLTAVYSISILVVNLISLKRPYLRVKRSELWIYHSYASRPQVVDWQKIHSFTELSRNRWRIELSEETIIFYLAPKKREVFLLLFREFHIPFLESSEKPV